MRVKFTHVRTEKERDGGNPPLGYLIHVSKHNWLNHAPEYKQEASTGEVTITFKFDRPLTMRVA